MQLSRNWVLLSYFRLFLVGGLLGRSEVVGIWEAVT